MVAKRAGGIWTLAPAASRPTETAAPYRCPLRKRAGSVAAAASAGARSPPRAGPQPRAGTPPAPLPKLSPLQSSCPAPDAQARSASAARIAGSGVHLQDSNAGSKNSAYRVTTCMLARTVFPVLRLRLVPSAHVLPVSLELFPLVPIIIGRFCHDLCSRWAIFLALGVLFPHAASPQIDRAARLEAPPPNFVDVDAVTLEVEGPLRKLRGAARVQTTEMVLYADEIDYNSDTTYAEARGSVHFKHFTRNEEIFASKVEYNMDDEKGKFYDVVGSTVTKIQTRPGVLSSTSPFHFEGKWAERLGEKYILHDGMITNCRMPRPWWTLRGPRFDIIPEDRALAYKAVFRVRKLPLFYTPYFYKSLAKVPRHSGFLTPNIGNSTRRGLTFGVGYFWAINRSYDVTYRLQDFTERGLAHNLE